MVSCTRCSLHVEQTIALLHWFRRLRTRWEIRDDIHGAFLTLAPAITGLKAKLSPGRVDGATGEVAAMRADGIPGQAPGRLVHRSRTRRGVRLRETQIIM
jgi:hypothetical protein